jgi:hypothetical protein
MAEHTLAPGKRWIENLLALGRALDYTCELEYDVAPESDRESPVDVAWFRSADDKVPLFIFEVESVPGSQMSHNAGKVLAQDTNLFEKPLFLFHVVVSGGSESTRPDIAEQIFGKANYRVYLASENGETTRMLCDVLSQHRRVCRDLEPERIVAALALDALPELDAQALLKHAEACGFNASWAKTYASLALSDEEMMAPLTRILGGELDGGPVRGEEYETWLATHYSRLLHLAILARLRPAKGEVCLAAIRAWQEQKIPPIAPMLGRNEDYDNFVFGWAPYLWALVAALMRDVDGAQTWILREMARILGPEDQPYALELGGLTAVWMLHVARSARDMESYARARNYLNGTGGVNPAMLATPPTRGGEIADLDEWGEQLRLAARPVPPVEQLPHEGATAGTNLELPRIALAQLLFDDPRDGPTTVLQKLGA